MKVTWIILLWSVATIAGAVMVESYGPVEIYYYDVGEVWNGVTSVQSWTAAQREDIHATIDEWDRVIINEPAAPIQLHMMWSELGSLSLGGASSHLTAGTDDSGDQIVWTGSELAWRDSVDTGNTWDTFIQCDVDAAGLAWNFGSDGPSATEIDFRSVVLHEMGHSLGWMSSYDVEYDDFGYGGYGLTTFDSFLVDSSGNVPNNGGTGIPDNFNQQDAPIYFTGSNATNLYGGLIPIYAPSSYQEGSSLSHLDTATFPDLTMSHAILAGDERRSLSALEIAMMSDMGWEVIPEPTTLSIILVGGCGMLITRRIFMV